MSQTDMEWVVCGLLYVLELDNLHCLYNEEMYWKLYSCDYMSSDAVQDNHK